jgi:cell shape-determining protein MreD
MFALTEKSFNILVIEDLLPTFVFNLTLALLCYYPVAQAIKKYQAKKATHEHQQ